MVQRLEVPHAPAGLRIETHDAFGEQVVAGPRPAVVVARRFFERHVHVAKLFVAADQRPGAAVPGVGPRVVEPRLVAELTLARHDVKRPQHLAGAHVVSADVVGRHLLRSSRALVQDVGRRRWHAADDDDVLDDHRAAAPAPTGDRPLEAFQQVDLAVVAEVGVAFPGLGVQRHEVAPDVREDPRVASVGPIRDAARRPAAGGALAVWPRRQRVEPDGLAGSRVERGHRADGRAHVEETVDHQRRVLIVGRPKRVRVEVPQFLGHTRSAPRNLQFLDAVFVDLIERRVFRAALVARVGRPVAILVRRAAGHRRNRNGEGNDRDESDLSVHLELLSKYGRRRG
jgi:hypothetical protein